MNSLTQINELLDNHFHEKFVSEEEHEHGWKDYDELEEAIDYLDEEFDEFYNSDNDYVDLCEIKRMCNFNTTAEICKYVCEKYNEYDTTYESWLCYFEDNEKILKSYVYYYMDENHKPKALETIEEFYGNNPQHEGCA